jgi:selenocysteine lyase/cysteine desulfurase
VAPYVEIDMNREEDCAFDAVFFSPHKFLGGPGSSGILVFNEDIYSRDLPPTTAGGGTVVYVAADGHDFSWDVEAREKAGTPPILQTIKATLVMELKDRIGIKTIEEKERFYTRYVLDRLRTMPNISIIGNADPEECLAIVSFNIKHRDRILHPKFVTRLLNDLFGIQTRAGCSCAGPYGHILLGIGGPASRKLRELIGRGYGGLKPGWVRINIHYTFSREDVDFLLRAINFVSEHGFLFLSQYEFDLTGGEWNHVDSKKEGIPFSLDHNFDGNSYDRQRLSELREDCFSRARALAASLELVGEPPFRKDDPEIESIKTFYSP